jgi:hypothetical protein
MFVLELLEDIIFYDSKRVNIKIYKLHKNKAIEQRKKI